MTTFNPLGTWNPDAPIDKAILADARAFLETLPDIPDGLIMRDYRHWSVAPYDATFPDYNFMVIIENGKCKIVTTHDPRDNAPGLNSNPQASHTWHRNTGAVGIAISGMSEATTHDFGPYPLQLHQIEYMCAAGAAVGVKYKIDAQGIVARGSVHQDDNGKIVNTHGEPNILTHAECAIIDSYPSERIDLFSLVPLPEGLEITPQMRTTTGNALRHRTHLYKVALLA